MQIEVVHRVDANEHAGNTGQHADQRIQPGQRTTPRPTEDGNESGEAQAADDQAEVEDCGTLRHADFAQLGHPMIER